MKYNKKGAPEVIAKLDEVRLRGRKRTMVYSVNKLLPKRRLLYQNCSV
jgi:hypothetical protein